MSNVSVSASYVQQTKVIRDKQYMIQTKNDIHLSV